MKRLIIILILLGAVSAGVSLAAPVEDYRLGPGDILGISVWGYPELQLAELAIRPDGKIAVPLAGEVQAAGLTPAELMVNLTKALGEYVKDPKITVNVVRFRTTRVYVLGEVTKPGLYEIEKEHRVLDAISAAGGFTRSSDKNKVYLVRYGDTQNYTLINLSTMLKRGDLTQNYVLNEGDALFLTRHALDYIKDILPFITAWSQVEDIRDN